MAATENVLLNILNDFASFLGEKDKGLFEDLTGRIESLRTQIMGGEVDAELDTIREIVAELKNLKDSQGNTPEAILSKFTAIEGRITTLSQEKDSLAEKVTAVESTANAAKAKAESVEQSIAQLPVTTSKADAADTLSKANKAAIEALQTKVTTLEGSAKQTDVSSLTLEALKQAYTTARS